MKHQFGRLWKVTGTARFKESYRKCGRMKNILISVSGFILTATIVFAATVNFADKSEYAFNYRSNLSDSQIAKDPEKAIQEAQENLREFGDWRINPQLRAKHSDRIAFWLLIIAKAKEAQSLSSEEAVKNYYELTEQFPDSTSVAGALHKIVRLDKKNGLNYAINFLEKYGAPGRITAFYITLVRDSLAEADYVNVKKYVSFFIDKYGSTRKGLELMIQLGDGLGTNCGREQLEKIIESRITEEPDSSLCRGFFRNRIITLLNTKNFTYALKLAKLVRRRFPGTKLADCAAAVLADSEYQKGNYISALEIFEPEIFSKDKPETAIIENIDKTLALYNANTLRMQGVDTGKIYESLAESLQNQGRYAVAVHCYRQSAKAGGFSIEAFERAAPEDTKYCNADAENEIRFWKGLLATEKGDLMTAAMIYQRFLKADDSSILAAVAYYNTARAKMTLGWYGEATEAIAKAKAISPCGPVVELEQKLTEK